MAPPIRPASDETLTTPRRKPRQAELGRHLGRFSSKRTTTYAWPQGDGSGFARITDHPANPYVPGDFPFYKFRDDVRLRPAEEVGVKFLPDIVDRQAHFKSRTTDMTLDEVADHIQARLDRIPDSGIGYFTPEQRANFDRMTAPGGGVYREFKGVENRKIHQRRMLQTFASPATVITRAVDGAFTRAWMNGLRKR